MPGSRRIESTVDGVSDVEPVGSAADANNECGRSVIKRAQQKITIQ